MKLDDVIREYKVKAEKSNNSINRREHYNAKKYEQIVKWLEELKAYRETDK